MQIFGIELLGSQLILSTIIGYILVKTIISYKNRQVSSSFFVLWLLFWLSTLYIIFYPGLLSQFASKLGIGRGVDLAIYVSIILIFNFLYKISIKIQDIERKFTKLIRIIAIGSKK